MPPPPPPPLPPLFPLTLQTEGKCDAVSTEEECRAYALQYADDKILRTTPPEQAHPLGCFILSDWNGLATAVFYKATTDAGTDVDCDPVSECVCSIPPPPPSPTPPPPTPPPPSVPPPPPPSPSFPAVAFIEPPSTMSLDAFQAACQARTDGAWGLVSVQSAKHVVWLAQQAADAGIDLSVGKGVPLGYDYVGGSNQVEYYDLTDSTRSITSIFAELKADGWTGDYYTNQRNDCGGSTPPGQPFAGFGWNSLPTPGIEDWGVCHSFNKILCEQKSFLVLA